MDLFHRSFSDFEIYAWEELLGDWFFVASLALLLLEFTRLLLKKALTWKVAGDTVTNFITYAAFIGLYYGLAGTFTVATFYYFHEHFSLTQIPTTLGSVILCVVLADFVYYWEHRFMHKVGFGWATHTVHHSSPYFNISVAYRFGPLDGLVPVFFHLPLAIAGFNPLVIFLAEAVVQLYQTALHTELVGKLPKPIEAVMNTPSHHRVHHGSNPQYLDKNYAGIFIVWDKLFGTFEEEREKVVYGIIDPIESVNPFVVFFHGFTRLAHQVTAAKGLGAKLGCLLRPPG
ncbi:MAG: sterol desaturase family protein [Kiloniellales bacterium]|nr:sterol desaturase family protein [Kiloniellales bacterium]